MKYLVLVLSFMLISFSLYAEEQWYDEKYKEWRDKRIKTILDFYGDRWFKGKKILEVGGALGEIGATFADFGADVTINEGRPEYCIIAEKRYPYVKVICADLDQEWAFDNHYDLIINMAVLYHLADPEKFLRECCSHCTHMVLESGIMDSFDDKLIIHRVEKGFDQSINNIGSFFSPFFVERILKYSGFSFFSFNDARCNAHYWSYDKPINGTGDITMHRRKMWFCKTAWVDIK